jgi:hypothetical protein
LELNFNRIHSCSSVFISVRLQALEV